MSVAGEACWQDAALAGAILAVAPAALGGAVVRAFPGPVRDSWLDLLRESIGNQNSWRKLPLHVHESRLLGGLDLVATLRRGEPVFEQGLLAAGDGGVVLLSMAERAEAAAVAQICAVLDRAEVVVERDGFSRRSAARLAVIALDESLDPDERVASALLDRLAFVPDLRAVGLADLADAGFTPADVARARERWQALALDIEAQQQLCAVALSLGIDSMRPVLFAARAACIAAALEDRDRIETADLALAARLVLLPRAPFAAIEDDADEAQPPPAETEHPAETEAPRESEDRPSREDVGELDDRVIEAASALLPPGLLAALGSGLESKRRQSAFGKAGALRYSRLRGRPVGSVPGDPRQAGRLDLLATLRSAAPWQSLRRQARDGADRGGAGIEIRSDDFRLKRFKRRSESTVVFVVDASGSAALHRLAEAKGAVELLLADCYVRRDRVALIAFRGRGADLLLPPTRSLVRAKRGLTALPGGGGTPLAAGIEAAAELVDGVRRRGGSPTVVVLTDGRANLCRDGSSGRERAFEDALQCASRLRLAGARCMVVDTSVRPHTHGAELARAMGGTYLPLPHADARELSRAIGARRDAAPA